MVNLSPHEYKYLKGKESLPGKELSAKGLLAGKTVSVDPEFCRPQRQFSTCP